MALVTGQAATDALDAPRRRRLLGVPWNWPAIVRDYRRPGRLEPAEWTGGVTLAYCGYSRARGPSLPTDDAVRGEQEEGTVSSTEENKAISNRMAEAINAQDFDAMDQLMEPAYAERFKAQMADVFRAFPDFHDVNELQVAEGDYVANRWRSTGTHRGRFMGIPATGRTVTTVGITIDEIRDGRLVGGTSFFDLEGVVQQLGAELRAQPLEDGRVPG
jgi:steroid delta-isomerase-like uncharacterized protein